MSIADKLTLLADTKEALRVKLGLGVDVPFSEYANHAYALFSPISLFAGGKQGVWYDPSDKSTLFQDVAGTIAVTKDGDPVALMRDKSGNGNHATQSLSASRPLYRTDGILHWLSFDGVDDYLETTDTINLSNTKSALLAISRKVNVVTGTANISHILDVTQQGSLQEYQRKTLNSSNGGSPTILLNSGSLVVAQAIDSRILPTSVLVVNSQIDTSKTTTAEEVSMRVNGLERVMEYGGAVESGSGNLGNNKLNIGGVNNAFSNMNLFGTVFVEGVVENKHRFEVDILLTSKSGVTL